MAITAVIRRRIGVGIGIVAIAAMGTLSACADDGKNGAPTTSSSTSVSPTEKGLDSRGGNLFTPAAPTTTPSYSSNNNSKLPPPPGPRPGGDGPRPHGPAGPGGPAGGGGPGGGGSGGGGGHP